MSARLRRYWKGSKAQGKSWRRRPPRSVATVKRERAKAQSRVDKLDPLYWPIMREFDFEIAERKRIDAFKKKGSMPLAEIKRRLRNSYAENDPFALVVIDGKEALVKVQLLDREWIEDATMDEVREVAIFG